MPPTLTEFGRLAARDFPHVVGGRVLVALSGGCDSVALLHLLADPLLRLELEAAHVHHGHRGDEADADAEFCARLCERRGVPFHLLRIPPLVRPPEGREAAWRRLRYRLLLETARARAILHVATAHHRDDVAEGVLMQLLRGGGPRALAGIERSTSHGVIRPLLPFDRAAIMAWLEERGIAWREDRSNRRLDHPRNVVRHRLLPVLERAFPAARGHLVALAAALAEDEAFMAGELARRARFADPWAPDGGIPADAVAELPRALRARWLLDQVARAGLGTVTRAQIQQLHGLLDHGSPRAVSLPGRWRLRLGRGELTLEPPTVPGPYELRLAAETSSPLPLPGWSVRLAPSASDGAVHRRWVAAGADLVLRSPKVDDVVGEGADRRRLLFVLRQRLPRHLRGAWPVLLVDGRIDWVPGVWHARDAGPTASQVVEVSRT